MESWGFLTNCQIKKVKQQYEVTKVKLIGAGAKDFASKIKYEAVTTNGK